MIGRAEDIIRKTGVRYSRDVDISSLSTLGLAARAAYLATPTNTAQLVCLVRGLTSNCIPHRVVGGMSNTMPRSPYYDGVLVNLRNINEKTVAENFVTADCGARLSSIVRALSHHSLGGIEQLYHIPGTLGGSVRGNAGAHGLEIGDVFLCGVFFDPTADAFVTLRREEMNFAYRHSRMKGSALLLLSATLLTEETSPMQIEERIRHFGALRANQPKGVRTLGSTFKRVEGVSAGYYIDKAGLKGLAVGGAAVSEVHAGFIVNRGDATPLDVLRLITIIKERVYREFGVILEEEIELL